MLLLLALLVLPPTTTRASACADAATASWAMSSLVRLMEADGAEADEMRALYSLPRVPRDSVIRIVDERICERASAAYYRGRLGPTPPGGVTVVRIQNRYAVYGAIRAGEWTIMTIYSSDFEQIANIAM